LLVLGALAAVSLAAAAGAATFVDVRANDPQIAGDPTSDATAVFPTNKQNEPSLAVNPTDARLLVAGANDEQEQPPCGPGPVRGADAVDSDCSFFPGIGSDGVYTSSDGAQTWTNRGLLDDQPGWQSSPLVSDGDPVIFYGPKPDGSGGFSYANGARAYYVGLASFKPGRSPYPPQKAPEVVALSFSDDDGATWSAPTVATIKSNPNDFGDKPSGWADDLPSSPWFGRVYVAFTEFRSALQLPAEPVGVAVSTDGGLSFGAPKKLSNAGNNGTGNGQQGSAVRSGPDGSVYVAWEDGIAQVLSYSRDGGQKWSRPVVVGPVDDLPDPIPGANFGTNSFLSLAVDPGNARTVYAAWVNQTGPGSAAVVLATSTNGGVSFGAPETVSTAGEGFPFYQGLDVAPNGRVDVGYQALVTGDADSFGTGNAAIDSWYRSKAGGAWSAPVKVSSASSDPAASAQNNLERQFFGDYSTLVSTNDRVWLAYTDTRNGAGCAAVDAYETSVAESGVAGPDEREGVAAGTSHGHSSGADPVAKPAPQLDCPDSQFGNSDVYVSVITP
jgi:hypothetical protein